MNSPPTTVNQKKFIFRTIIFLGTLILALYDITVLEDLFFRDIGYLKVYQLLWFFLLAELILFFIPRFSLYLGCGKVYARNYRQADYNKGKLRKYTEKYNRRALLVLFLWLTLLSGIGYLYFKELIAKRHLFLIMIFFYFSDQVCINIWCPFRSWIVRNKCCNACRIYNWGQFMYISPLIFIPSFWTYSLVIVSLLILIQWEYLHYKYPERFSAISNLNLRCTYCLTKCKKQLPTKSKSACL
jgi:hypothetical protein